MAKQILEQKTQEEFVKCEARCDKRDCKGLIPRYETRRVGPYIVCIEYGERYLTLQED